jgi:hypothetical protein
MKKSRWFGKILLISSTLTLILPHPYPSFSAQTCTPLLAVAGEPGQTVVRKTVSAPSIPVGIGRLKRDNWNTDFAVPSNVKYKRFVATLTPQTGGTYSIRMYLKYNNGTADEVYKNKPNLSSGKALVMSGTPRAKEQPYQVNVFVGDAESVAKSYKISVKACR